MGARRRKPRRLFVVAWLQTAVRSAVAWFCVLVCVGVALTLCGIYLLAGLGWTLVSSGLAFLAGAWFLKLGISTHA